MINTGGGRRKLGGCTRNEGVPVLVEVFFSQAAIKGNKEA